MFWKKHFTLDDVPDLTGKVAIVTGGNTGIGYAIAKELSRKNAHVFVASRGKERGEEAVEKIKEETGNNRVEYLYLDLSKLKAVKKSAENFLSKNLPLHILVNNAGIMATPWTLTEDGIQDQFGVNHVGHFLFTVTLLPKLEASAPSRIVNVSSEGHRYYVPAAGIEFDNINQENAESTWQRYGVSKLANILFARSLAKRLEGKEVYANSIHPGIVKTEISRGPIALHGLLADLAFKIFFLFALSPDDGALSSLYAATSPEIVEKNYRGKYFVTYGTMGTEKVPDDALAEKLWKYTEDLIDEKLR